MDSTIATIALPAALAIIMLGLGLSLTVADFTRLIRVPGTVALILGCQIILLPLICFGLVLLFQPPPALAVGMMLLAASPGGTTASLYSHLFRGNVALNISLTALNSLTAMVTLPLITNLSLAYFMSDGDTLGLQADKVLQVFAIILIPVAIGMLIRAKAEPFALRMEKPVKIASVFVLFGVIAVAVYQELDNIGDYIVSVGLMVLLFNIAGLVIGYWAPRLIGTGRPESIASCMEIGLHNTTLSLAIALSPALLNSTEIAIPSAVYGVLMFFTAAATGALLARRSAREDLVREGAN
ncbi:bile acid:sodium symporter family protein [Nocardiopsis lambiniae]|uniref:Bile acid:sodium symporter family protein n=1 Tax=Nocardiopsis lambiniae TaxID=3075539 RepID=A0ABU2M501_9ACTN|nr:bile acid:sodium symporter family protein [Nocardiopsis sp. DSM 44743]MDT0327721.1 bile acid:sodium symporter family protein [Nocardiopsis sp. DSM 44743]